MKSFLFLLSLALVSAANVTSEDPRTFPGALLLPAVLLPYAAAVTAVAIPLAKTLLGHALKVLNLPFEALIVLYLVFYAMVFAFPGIASLLTVTGTVTGRSAEDSSSFRAGMTAWLQSLLPSWTSETTTSTRVPLSYLPTLPWTLMDSHATSTMSSLIPTSTSGTTATATSSSSSQDVPTPSSVCSSHRVCVSVSKLVKDYPVSVMLMTYLGDYLQGLEYERPVREGMAGIDCGLVYPGCQE